MNSDQTWIVKIVARLLRPATANLELCHSRIENNNKKTSLVLKNLNKARQIRPSRIM